MDKLVETNLEKKNNLFCYLQSAYFQLYSEVIEEKVKFETQCFSLWSLIFLPCP